MVSSVEGSELVQMLVLQQVSSSFSPQAVAKAANATKVSRVFKDISSSMVLQCRFSLQIRTAPKSQPLKQTLIQGSQNYFTLR